MLQRGYDSDVDSDGEEARIPNKAFRQNWVTLPLRVFSETRDMLYLGVQ